MTLMIRVCFSYCTLVMLCILMPSTRGVAQISPGELAKVHSHLEGMANCTQCHTLGAKVSNEKCLDCHTEVKKRLVESKGFHASPKVAGKSCTICHSDHYGRNFDIVHLQKEKFNHDDTGYKLEGKHIKKDCADCHKKEYIKDVQIQKKQQTFLGLNGQCITCHEDIHQKNLSQNCQNCHSFDSFKPASKFNHTAAKYQLKGKHAEVLCIKCHPINNVNGKNFQQFTGMHFQNCVPCHKDPHENKFGQNCLQCHVEESFKTVRSLGLFDHSKAGYPLTGRHVQVACKACHKTTITAKIKHEKCVDCHTDYHKGQFRTEQKNSDCSDCHDVTGFSTFSYSTEKHNQSKFKIEGAHLATPCFECHKKGKEWSFRGVGEKCVDCHKDIHVNLLDTKFYPDSRCENCHSVSVWNEIKFDHKATSFALEGKHKLKSCRECHFKKEVGYEIAQKFNKLNGDCENCHPDIHRRQFREDQKTVCLRCHGFESWKAEKFNHNTTKFKLDGGHKNVACNKCHKEYTDESGKYINYKIKDLRCINCHL